MPSHFTLQINLWPFSSNLANTLRHSNHCQSTFGSIKTSKIKNKFVPCPLVWSLQILIFNFHCTHVPTELSDNLGQQSITTLVTLVHLNTDQFALECSRKYPFFFCVTFPYPDSVTVCEAIHTPLSCKEIRAARVVPLFANLYLPSPVGTGQPRLYPLLIVCFPCPCQKTPI